MDPSGAANDAFFSPISSMHFIQPLVDRICTFVKPLWKDFSAGSQHQNPAAATLSRDVSCAVVELASHLEKTWQQESFGQFAVRSIPFLSKEMLYLFIITSSGAEAVTRDHNRATAAVKAAKEASADNSRLDDAVYQIAMSVLKNLSSALKNDGSTASTQQLSTHNDMFKWLQCLLDIWKPLAAMLINAVQSDSWWRQDQMRLNRLVRFSHSVQIAMQDLSVRLERGNHRRLFGIFCDDKNTVLHQCLRVMDALSHAENANWVQVLVGAVQRTIEVVFFRDKDIEDIASVAQSHKGESGSMGHKSSKIEGKDGKVRDSKSTPSANTSYYRRLYDAVEFYCAQAQELYPSAFDSKTATHGVIYTGPARLLRLYLMGSLRVALSDKLQIAEGPTGSAMAGALRDKAAIEAHLSAGRALEVAPFITNATSGRKHVLRLLQVGYVMLMHVNSAATSHEAVGDVKGAVFCSYCRVQILQQLSRALQGSIPNHVSLESLMEKFSTLCKASTVTLLERCPRTTDVGGAKEQAERATQTALQLQYLITLIKLDHRFLLGHQEAAGGDVDEGAHIRRIYESLMVCGSGCENTSVEYMGLRSAQQQILDLLIELHAQLSRLDVLVKDVCSVAHRLGEDQVSPSLLHDLFGSPSSQKMLVSSFAAAPEVQREGIWECLAQNADFRHPVGVLLIPLLLRPLVSSHSTRGSIRGGGTFLAPPPGPVGQLLASATSCLHDLLECTTATNCSQLKSSRKKNRVNDEVIGRALENEAIKPVWCVTEVVSALLAVSENAVAKLTPDTAASWRPVVESSRILSHTPTVLSPLQAPTDGGEVGARQASASFRLLVATTTFTATSQLCLENSAPQSVIREAVKTGICETLHEAVKSVVFEICTMPVEHGASSDLFRVLIETAPFWESSITVTNALVTTQIIDGMASHLSMGIHALQQHLQHASVRDIPLIRNALNQAVKSQVEVLDDEQIPKKRTKARAKTVGPSVEKLCSAAERLSLLASFATVPSSDEDKRSLLAGVVKGIRCISKYLIESTDDKLTAALKRGLSALSATCMRMLTSPWLSKGERLSALQLTEGLVYAPDNSEENFYLEGICSLEQSQESCSSQSALRADSDPAVAFACLILDAVIVKLTMSVASSEQASSTSTSSLVSDVMSILSKLASLARSGEHPNHPNHPHTWVPVALWRAASNAVSSCDWRDECISKALGPSLLELLESQVQVFHQMARGSCSEDFYVYMSEVFRLRCAVTCCSAGVSDSTLANKVQTELQAILLHKPAHHEPMYGWMILFGTYMHCLRLEGCCLSDNTSRQCAQTLRDLMLTSQHLPPQDEISLAVSGLCMSASQQSFSEVCAELTTGATLAVTHPRNSLLVIRIATAIANAYTMYPEYTGPIACTAIRELVGIAPAIAMNSVLGKRGRSGGDSHTPEDVPERREDGTYLVNFFREALPLLRNLLSFLQNTGPNSSAKLKKKHANSNGGAVEGDLATRWAASCLGLLGSLSAVATSTFQANPTDKYMNEYCTHLLQASERILLSSMGASTITNAGVNLVASLCQGIHIALHCHGDVTVPLAVANRALLAASTCKPFSMYAYSLLASIFDIAGYSTSPLVLQRFPGLHAGIFALLDACTDPKVKKRLIALLGEEALAVYREVQDKYTREYKFKGRV